MSSISEEPPNESTEATNSPITGTDDGGEDSSTTKLDDLTSSSRSEITSRRKRRLSFMSKAEESGNKKEDDHENNKDENISGSSPLTSISCNSLSTPSGQRRFKESDKPIGSNVSPTKSRKNDKRIYVEEENEGACCECEGGGELICCDTCVRAFHLVCLPQRYRPIEQSDTSGTPDWSCPVCLYFRVHDDLEKRRGVLLTLQHPLPIPSRDCDPRVKRLKSRRALDNDDFSEEEDEEDEQSAAVRRPKRFTHQDLYRQSHHHYLFEDIKKRRTTAGSVAPDSEPQSECAVGSRTRRQAAASDKKEASFSASSAPSTCSTIGRMNVGPTFQIPSIPLSFVEVQELGRSYNRDRTHRYSRALADTRVVYSATEWLRRAKRIRTVTPFEEEELRLFQNKKVENNEDVDGVSNEESRIMEDESIDMKVLNLLLKEMDEVAGSSDTSIEVSQAEKENFVDSEEKLKEFCRVLSARWSSKCYWPYCDEYAYKILYYAKFDARSALQAVEDPKFDFYGVCDPPVRPYFNKWKPRDKRSMFPSTPFPPPSHFRAAFFATGGRTRQQGTYSYK